MPDKKLDQVLEGYKPIPMKRLYYPRGMTLSEDFINAFHREFDRLVDEGVNPKNLVNRFGKAMKFHVTEERAYHLLDDENARLAALQEKKKSLPPWLDKNKDESDEDGENPTDKDKDTKSKAHKKKHK